MNAKELLNPRYEVIAKFPDSIVPIGTILNQTVTDYFDYNGVGDRQWTIRIKNIEDYPHLFRKLNWWELRTTEEMPKKVFGIQYPDEVYQIEKWDMDMMFGFIDSAKRSGCDLLAFKPEFGYLPTD